MPPAVNLTETARSEQLFKINGFAATKEKAGFTASRVCAVGGHDWRIEFHPKVMDASNVYGFDDWIMFRVQLISKGAGGVAASFSCRLMDPKYHGISSDLDEKIVSSMFCENKSMDVLLIRRCDLEGSRRQYVKDDCILVRCAINVLLCEPKDVAAVGAASNAVASVPSSDLHQQFGELLRSQKGADITFLVSGESVAAHRCVLAARSPVFMAELFGDMKEMASPWVEIKDMEVEVFRAMLHFIYTDTVPELDQKEVDVTLMAQHLLEAADRFGLESLKRICVEKVWTNISVDTVATALALAEQHGCSDLKSRCMKFILATPENLNAVTATEGYNLLVAIYPSVLTELLKLMAKRNK